MKVVSNTSPICYLQEIEQIRLLPTFFQEVYIPEAVFKELQNPGAPDALQNWITSPPSWLIISKVNWINDPDLNRLHKGEAEAILLAESIEADLLIIDEKPAREIAMERGFQVTGLLGILDWAAQNEIIDIVESIVRLNATNFRAPPRLIKFILEKYKLY